MPERGGKLRSGHAAARTLSIVRTGKIGNNYAQGTKMFGPPAAWGMRRTPPAHPAQPMMLSAKRQLLALLFFALGGLVACAPPIHRDEQGRSANLSQAGKIHRGAVKSPYAPDKPPVGVRGLAYGTQVQCPYTGNAFVVPEPYRTVGLTYDEWVSHNMPAEQRPEETRDPNERLYIPRPSTLRP